MPRFEFSNYAQVAKLEKTEYNAIKKKMFSIFQKLGRCGTSKPVAYDTAWAARVPKFDDLALPAFPQCLQWLRDNQKEDGSWGEDYPFLIHSKVLNTFTAVLALSQWRLEEDEERLKKGLDALRNLSEKLPKEKTGSFTFEMILSALVDDAHTFQLDLPYANFERFVKIGKNEVKRIQKGLVSNVPNQYWTILEAAGKTVELHPAYYRLEIKRYGLIAAQPSTTAFVLHKARLRGENYTEAEWALEQLSLEHNGGLPHLYPSDNFDLIHSLDFLTTVGINPILSDKHEAAFNAMGTLSERWDSKLGIGFSSRWYFSDYNCTEMAAWVLKKSSHVVNVTRERRNISYFRMTQTKSQTELLGVKTAHLLFDAKRSSSKEPYSLKSTPFLTSILNVSKYYRFMRTILKSYLNNTGPLPRIVDELIKSQNADGGWGGQGKSSAEETAYVCLTMFELTRYRSDILNSIDFLKLVEFVRNTEISSESEGMWYWKVSFCSPGLSDAAIVAAKYAVYQMQRVCLMTDAFNDCKLDYNEVDFSDSASNEIIYHGECLRYNPEGCPENTEDRKKVLEKLLMNFFEDDALSPYSRAMIETYLDVSYHIHPVSLSLEHRVIDIATIFLVVAIDDIVDLFHPGRDDMVEGLDEFLRATIAILEDENRGTEIVPPFESPFCTYFIKFLLFLRRAIKDNGWNCKMFVKELRDLFHAHILVRKDLCNDIEPTVKRYLQIHSVSSTLRALIQQIFMVDSVKVAAKTEDVYAYNRFLESACKVCRILSDFPSVLKDAEIPTLDNFCLRLQRQYKVSIQESIQMAVRKINKEILKMHVLKRIIQTDPKYKQYTDLPSRMKYVDVFLDGTLIWSLSTYRYKSKWMKDSAEIKHEEKDSTFVRNLCFDL